MTFRKLLIFAVATTVAMQLSAADKRSKEGSQAAKPLYEQAQPATENLDFTMYQRVRDEVDQATDACVDEPLPPPEMALGGVYADPADTEKLWFKLL